MGHGAHGGGDAHKTAYETAKAALLAKVLPLYNQVKDPQQQVAFVTSMITHGPRITPVGQPGAGLQILDFPGMTNETYGHYAQQPYDPVNVTYGGEAVGPYAMSVQALHDLITLAKSYGAK